MNTRLRYSISVFFVLLFALPAMLLAAEEPVEYIIKKGDTLWGISDRFLKDPNYWPSLWSKNPDVTNPHLIYPGQKVRFVDGRMEIVPESEAGGQKASTGEQPQPEQAEEKIFTARGNEGSLLEKELKPAGRIIAGQHSRIILGEDDIAFTDIGTVNGGVEGQKYSIIRKSTTVSHPVTSEIIGIKYYPLGTLQLSRVARDSSRAIITRSFKEIEPGDLLMPYREVKRREIILKSASAPVKGMIVETYSGNNVVAAGDTVYLDLGKKDGVEVGNLFYVVRQVTVEKMMVHTHVKQFPYEVVGALLVVKTGKRTSTALIIKSIDAIFKKDKVVTAPK